MSETNGTGAGAGNEVGAGPDSDEDIYFYGRSKGRVSARYRFLSNFYRAPMTIDGKAYPTVEHYFQAMKCADRDPGLAERVRTAGSPGAAKKLAWEHEAPADWDARRDSVMLTALRAKFAQHPALREHLLATGAARLHEDAPRDAYWGVCGADRLGRLLMQVRDKLRDGE